MERNVLKKKNTRHKKRSYLQDEACLRIKTEIPNDYYDTLIPMFECSQQSSNKATPNLHPVPRHRAVLFLPTGWLAGQD